MAALAQRSPTAAFAALAPNGYQSQIGRAAKAPGAIEELGFPGSGWIERVQSAQYNTWESAILAARLLLRRRRG